MGSGRLIAILSVISFTMTGCLSGEFHSGTSGVGVTLPGADPALDNSITLKVHVLGAGQVNILGADDPCDSSQDCDVKLEKGAVTEFQADWDDSDGLQLVSFSGCDSLAGSGSICRITADSSKTIVATFSKAPIAQFLYDDQDSVIFLSLFDLDQKALTFDPDGTIESGAVTATNGVTFFCAYQGDAGQPADNSKCWTDPDYFFMAEVDPSLSSLNVSLNVTDNTGLSFSYSQTIR